MTLVNRPSPRNKFEFFERGWRIALAWVCVVFLIVPLSICAAVVVVAFTYGFINAIVTGQPMPDLTAGLDRVLPSIMPYIGPGIAALFTLLVTRHREVNTALGGGQSTSPFDPSSSPHSPSETSPTGGLVNNNALDSTLGESS